MKTKAKRVDTRLENAQKAFQCAEFLVSDLRSLFNSAGSNNDAALGMLALDMIGQVATLRDRLDRLKTALEENQ